MVKTTSLWAGATFRKVLETPPALVAISLTVGVVPSELAPTQTAHRETAIPCEALNVVLQGKTKVKERNLAFEREQQRFEQQARVTPLLSPWCARENVPTGVNLNRYSGSGSCIPWHSDNESLFGPPNQPKLIVSMSLGHSVVFQVCRVPGDVPCSVTLVHGVFFLTTRRCSRGHVKTLLPN